ncbi:hypothetical protein OHA18_37900 [Kribbella sp. NBC_00709]|uniref:hypothetical protein n=1 Tax=Kribbella sp. NBC_00709 TaxID=2975972 RepID=UPI002E2A1976|nr:hypothetical protein [Kribbella sp. NBC_00709]
MAERARVHAALGDPARLVIVDAWAAGDVAPGELGAASLAPAPRATVDVPMSASDRTR